MHAAEVYFASAGRRVFDIAIESETVVSRLDLVRDVGQAHAWRRSVDVDVDDGVLDVELIHQIDGLVIRFCC